MRAWQLIKPTKDSTSTHGEIYSAIELPELPDEWTHIPSWFTALGECVHNGAMYQPVPFTEIESWSRQTGLELTHFEAQLLRTLSVVFSAMLNRSEKQEPCPVELPEDGMLQSEADMMAAVASWKAMAITAETAEPPAPKPVRLLPGAVPKYLALPAPPALLRLPAPEYPTDGRD